MKERTGVPEKWIEAIPVSGPAAEPPLLELRKVSYAYEEGRPALREVSVAFREGERVAVLGNNGAGKSTFFLCLNGVLRPGEGQLFFRGRQLGRKGRELNLLRREVGLIFQEPDQQIIASTVESEISFGPLNLRLPEGEVRRRVEAALQAMELEAYRRRPPHYLSGGEKSGSALRIFWPWSLGCFSLTSLRPLWIRQIRRVWRRRWRSFRQRDWLWWYPPMMWILPGALPDGSWYFMPAA